LGILNGMAAAALQGRAERIRRTTQGTHDPFELRVTACRWSACPSPLRLCRALPADWEGRFIADQLSRASARTSANYHAACRARSRRDFINKLGMVVEESDESDESVFWLAFVGRSALNETAEQKDLLAEGRELLAIFIQSAKTASTNNNPQ
jgi:four helix bundle protein